MKQLALLLALTLVAVLLPPAALAATGGSCGTNITWSYTSSNKTLTITCNGQGAMNDYNRFDSNPWYEHRLNINKVVMTGYITYIGKNNFYGITADFTLPDTIKEVNSYGLAYCTFNSFNMPALLETIDKSAFEYSVFKQPVVIPNGVQNISWYAFQSCTFSSLTLPQNLKTIEMNAFVYGRGLTDVVLPEGMTSLGSNAFYNSSLTSISIPASLTGYSGTFGYCYNLKAINVSPDNTILSSADGVLFNKAGTVLREYPMNKEEESYTVPDGVTQLDGSAFYRTKHLKHVVLPEGITAIPPSAFLGAAQLTDVELPAGLTEIGGSAFEECAGLTELMIPDGVTSLGNRVFYKSGIQRLTVPASVTSFGENLFYQCPENLTLCLYAGSPAHEYALANNIAVEFLSPFGKADVVLPDDLEIVDEGAFEGIDAATVFIPDGVTEIGSRAFADCPNLKHIHLPNGLTIADDAFDGVTDLFVYGPEGGFAESYADSHDGITFIPIND